MSRRWRGLQDNSQSVAGDVGSHKSAARRRSLRGFGSRQGVETLQRIRVSAPESVFSPDLRGWRFDRQRERERRTGPSFGSAHSRPPWASMIDRQIVRPIPMPCGRRYGATGGVVDALRTGSERITPGWWTTSCCRACRRSTPCPRRARRSDTSRRRERRSRTVAHRRTRTLPAHWDIGSRPRVAPRNRRSLGLTS
jgi:hypothetical protein